VPKIHYPVLREEVLALIQMMFGDSDPPDLKSEPPVTNTVH